MSHRLMLSAAEVSGDMHGAHLAREVLRREPRAVLFGMGGIRMAKAGVEVGIDITDLSTFGLVGVLDSLPRRLKALAAVRRMMARARPDALILIDSPGFNFAVAASARRLGIPAIYYVAPQTWLWNPRNAARRLRRSVDLAVAIFEREAESYRREGVNFVYHGHPLGDLGRNGWRASAIRRELGIPDGRPCIGLLPGSRRREIVQLLPEMLAAVDGIEAALGPVSVVLGVASPRLQDCVRGVVSRRRPGLHVVESDAHATLTCADASLAASGTVLLEAAALDAPVVMTYKIDPLTRVFGRLVLKLPQRLRFYAMPNILVGERIVPELVLGDANPASMTNELLLLLRDEEARERIRQGYARVRSRLGPSGAVARVAEDILEFVAAAAPSAVPAMPARERLFER
jgi:lipid-A-disaccharide synthase